MDSLLQQSKTNIFNALGRLISDAEAFANKNGKKLDKSTLQDSMEVYNLIRQNQASGDLMARLASLLNGISEVIEKGVVSDVKSEQEGGVNSDSR